MNSHLSERIKNYYFKNRAKLFESRVFELLGGNHFISFTFDDFPRSAYLTGGAILKKYKIRASYYASLGLMGKESPVGTIFSLEDIKKIVQDGHEVGCHTYDHFDAWETRPFAFEESILRNQEALRKLIPEISLKTMSYPKREPHPGVKRISAKHFQCCRGGGQTFNFGKLDLNLIKSCFIDKINKENLATLKGLIDRNRVRRGWLVFSTHDIRHSPSRFGCEPDYFEEIVRYSVDSGAIILPVCEVYSVIVRS